MNSAQVDGLMDELAKAKEEGALGMMRLIYKKMQNAVYSRYIMNWKKNRSCTILEGKIDGGGLAFLEDAKRKEGKLGQDVYDANWLACDCYLRPGELVNLTVSQISPPTTPYSRPVMTGTWTTPMVASSPAKRPAAVTVL